jgi:hypothetical protein
MRINEIASAEDQIALFKLITDKVWQALGDQQHAEANRKAAQPLKSKLKPTAKVARPRSMAKPAVKPMSFKTTLAKPAQPKAQSSANMKVQHPSQTAQPRQKPNTPFNSAKQSSIANTAFDSKSQSLNTDHEHKQKDFKGNDKHS